MGAVCDIPAHKSAKIPNTLVAGQSIKTWILLQNYHTLGNLLQTCFKNSAVL